MTALSKPHGGVRGIVVGDVLRRGVSTTLARQYSTTFVDATAPAQFALGTRAGVEAIVFMARSLAEADGDLVLLSLDGIGAYDHIKRAAMLGKLRDLPSAQAILPFVLLFYGQASTYTMYDEHGNPQDIVQAEGGEHGDPLMPALYALGQHEALRQASQELHSDDVLMAFLDDLYLITSRDRVAEAIKTVLATWNASQGSAHIWGSSKSGALSVAVRLRDLVR